MLPIGPDSAPQRPDADRYADELAAHAVALTNLIFASPGLAHEIGNCLQAAGLHLEMLTLEHSNAGLGQADDASAVALREQLDRIRRLVSAWVDATVPISSEPVVFDLRQVVSDAVQLLTVALRHRGIDLHVASAECALLINGDRFALMHVCASLMLNTCEAMPFGGQLTVNCDALVGRSARIRISGTGCRVSSDPAMREFDRGNTDREARLSFSQRTLERHNGRLQWANEPDCGPAFWLELPLAGSCPD